MPETSRTEIKANFNTTEKSQGAFSLLGFFFYSGLFHKQTTNWSVSQFFYDNLKVNQSNAQTCPAPHNSSGCQQESWQKMFGECFINAFKAFILFLPWSE